MSSASSSSSQSELDDLRSLVFGNDLLRERILELAIMEDNNVSGETIRTCRLVHSSWRLSITKCLRKLREPLFTLHLTNGVEKQSLERFRAAVMNSLEREEQFPPTHLLVSRTYYSTGTLQNVADWISQLGCSLVKISAVTLTHGNFAEPVTLSNVNFPILRHLNIWLEDSDYVFGRNLEGDANITNVIQLILSGCQELKHFKLFGKVKDEDPFPVDFENLRLPPTLTNLQLRRRLNSDQLLGLTASALPMLTTLTLPIKGYPLKHNLVFSVLNKFRSTLKHLVLLGQQEKDIFYLVDYHLQPTRIQLPRMESLETLAIQCSHIRWPQDSPAAEAARQIPALRKIYFSRQDLAQFRHWTEGPQLESVVDVHVTVTNHDEDNADILQRFTALVLRGFPNVVKLHLDFRLRHGIHGLPFVFENFTQLQELGLTIHDNNGNMEKFNIFISVFLGIPKKWATEVVAMSKWLNEASFTKESRSSINNMTELRRIRLRYRLRRIPVFIRAPFDSVFYFGLMKMTNLQEVYLDGGIKVSTETAIKWRESGRKLEISSIY